MMRPIPEKHIIYYDIATFTLLGIFIVIALFQGEIAVAILGFFVFLFFLVVSFPKSFPLKYWGGLLYRSWHYFFRVSKGAYFEHRIRCCDRSFLAVIASSSPFLFVLALASGGVCSILMTDGITLGTCIVCLIPIFVFCGFICLLAKPFWHSVQQARSYTKYPTQLEISPYPIFYGKSFDFCLIQEGVSGDCSYDIFLERTFSSDDGSGLVTKSKKVSSQNVIRNSGNGTFMDIRSFSIGPPLRRRKKRNAKKTKRQKETSIRDDVYWKIRFTISSLTDNVTFAREFVILCMDAAVVAQEGSSTPNP